MAPIGYVNFWLCVSSKEEAQQALASLSFASSGPQGVGLPSRLRGLVSEIKGSGLDGAVLAVLGKASADEAQELERLRSRFEDQQVKHDSRFTKFVLEEFRARHGVTGQQPGASLQAARARRGSQTA